MLPIETAIMIKLNPWNMYCQLSLWMRFAGVYQSIYRLPQLEKWGANYTFLLQLLNHADATMWSDHILQKLG